jgi:DNA-binding beta-propeller fold protein YncE
MRVTAGIMALVLTCWMGGSVAIQEGSVTAETHTLPHMALALAPEFPSGMQWLNSDRPLTLRELRGKVVLLDFWTYGCINCLHILPDLHRLEVTYARELVVVGVHSAKYDNETALANIRQAVRRYGITHPVVNDHDLRIWNAYRVPGWPTQILIDPEGHQLQGFIGENHLTRLDRLIKATVALHRRKGTLRDDTSPLQIPSRKAERTSLLYPGKVLADVASSRLFIADTNHHHLVVTDLQGNLQAVIGSGIAGSDDGSFESATFRQPQGMALQGAILYVADTGNHLLRRVDLRRQVVETMVGTGEKAREFNVPGTGRTVPLNSPWDLYGYGQYLYMAMAGMHQIWRVDLSTAYVEPFSGSGREALIDDTHIDAALGQPSGLSGDGQRLYVADSEVNAVRVASLDPDGVITTLAGGGLFTFGDHDGVGHEARLQHPLGVTYADGTVYVADTYNHKIKWLDPRSGRLQTLAGTGVAGYRNGEALQAQFYEPGGISVSAGIVYVADTNNHRVRVMNLATQQISTLPIRGLTPPIVTVSRAITNGDIEVVRLDEQQLLASTPATVRLVLAPPPGWKVNTAAPATLAVKIVGDGVRVPAGYTRRTFQPFVPELAIPLEVTLAGAQAHLRVDLAFVICQVNNQGICALRRVAWECPVRSQTQMAPTELTLRYAMSSF